MKMLDQLWLRTKAAFGFRTNEDAAKWRRIFGKGDVWDDAPITAQTALQLSAVWSCVRLISETVATLPIGIFERQKDGSRIAVEHPLYGLLHDSPNADQTAVEFWEGQVGSLCLCGNGYSEKKMTGDRITALDPLPPAQVQPYRTTDGALRYRISDRGKQEELPEEKVFHIRGFGLGGDVGLSPIAYARQTLGVASATESAAGRTFSQGLRATGIFTTPVKLNPDQEKAFRQNYIAPAEGVENEGKQIILPPGFDWKGININPKDAETLLSRRHSVEEICRWFRTPPVLIGHASEGQTMWGSGIEQIMIGWLTLGLRSYLKRIESAVRKRLFTPAERLRYFAEFNVEGLLRADSQARAQFYSIMAQNGIMSRNEIRAKENLTAAPGGDQLTVQVNLVPLDQLGAPEQRSGVAARQALLDWLHGGSEQSADSRPRLEVVK